MDTKYSIDPQTFNILKAIFFLQCVYTEYLTA